MNRNLHKTKIEDLVLKKLSLIERKVENIASSIPIVPANGFYTSKQVQQILQVDDEILGKMRRTKQIEFIQAHKGYRYKADQPIFHGIQDLNPEHKPYLKDIHGVNKRISDLNVKFTNKSRLSEILNNE